MTEPSGPTVHPDLERPSAWDTFVEASEPGSYLQLSPWAGVKAVNGWSAHRIVADAAADGPIGAQVLVRRPRPMPWAFAYAPRGPVATSWTPAAIEAFTDRVRASLPSAAGRVSHLRIDPEIEADGPHDPDGALRRALRAAGWRPAPAIQPASTRVIDLRADEAALWGDLRKKWRQYVNKARTGGRGRGRCRRRPAGRVLPDLPRDRRPGRVPHPHRGGLPRRLGRLPPGRPGAPPVRPDGRRRAGRHALPRAERAARRRAVRRHDRGRCRLAGQLPPQVGGHPDVARAGRDELRPVGPRDRRHRPFQDRLRRPRGPLHRGVGPGPRPARPPGLRGGPQGTGPLGAVASRAIGCDRRRGISGAAD